MRLWTVNPEYLDSIGLVALWREGLLAQKVLLGQTKGYTQHPQLHRFRACADPVVSICSYLNEVVKEASRRGYRFDRSKIVMTGVCDIIRIQQGQMEFEWKHLLQKLEGRSPHVYQVHKGVLIPKPHPLFEIVPGGIEDWERA